MKNLYESVLTEWKQDCLPQAVVIMGGPGAGKTYFMNHYAKKYFQNNITFKKLDSDHNLEKYQRYHVYEIAERIIKGISGTVNSEYPTRRQQFDALIRDIQSEIEIDSNNNHSAILDITDIDFGFCKSWSDRYDNAKDTMKDSVVKKFQDSFFNKYFKDMFASDFSVRHLSKAEYKKDFQSKLKGEDEDYDFIGSSDVVVAITGDELKKFQDVLDVVKDTHAVQVIYLNVPIEMSIRQDKQRDRSVGERLIREIMNGVHKTWDELLENYKKMGIWKLHEFVPEDPTARYINWKLNKVYTNTDLIKSR